MSRRAGRGLETSTGCREPGSNRGQVPPKIAGFEAQPQRSIRAVAACDLRRRRSAQLIRELGRMAPAQGKPGVPAREPATAAQRVHGGAPPLHARSRR
jgi:hypothetical protein